MLPYIAANATAVLDPQPRRPWWRRAVGSVFCLTAFMLVGCGGGGGDQSVDVERSAQGVRATALGSAPLQASTDAQTLKLRVLSVTKIAEKRVSRTVFEYTFRVQVGNEGVSSQSVQLELAGVGPGSTVVDGRAFVGDLLAGQVVSADDLITVRHDRTVAFDSSAWAWRYSGLPSVLPIVPGAILTSGLTEPMPVGVRHQDVLLFVPSDQRNRVSDISVANPTAGGAKPAIDAAGRFEWMPSDTDFETPYLTFTVTLSDGSRTSTDVPVYVTRSRTVEVITLSGTGTYSDRLSRYEVEVASAAGAGPVSGTLTIREQYDRRGYYAETVTSSDPSLRIRIVRFPPPDLTIGPAASSLDRNSRSASRIRRDAAGRVRALALPEVRSPDEGNPSLPYSLVLPGQILASPSDALSVVRVRLATSRTDVQKPGRLGFGERYAIRGVAKIDGNCVTVTTGPAGAQRCDSLQGTPVILIHGYVNTIDSRGDLGGGTRTWGELATELDDRGHPVFELRWLSQMRFEEAAGLLARLARDVASATGRQPAIIAHSFGGVVAHLAAAGEGVVWSPATQQWVKQRALDSVLDSLITLGSPLSGINVAIGRSLAVGKDDSDPFLPNCLQVTCVQAGLEVTQGPAAAALDELVAIVDGNSALRTGESISRLLGHWNNPSSSLNAMRARIQAVVTLREVQSDRGYTESNAYKLGDGLISIVGQAMRPLDFLGSEPASFPPPAEYRVGRYLSSHREFSPSFFAKLNATPAAGASDWMLRATIDGRNYLIARRAAHTSGYDEVIAQYYFPVVQGSTTSGICAELRSFRIAHFREDVVTDVANCSAVTVKHPLVQVMDTYLKKGSPTPYAEPTVRLGFSGQVFVENNTPASGISAMLTVLDAEDRAVAAASPVSVTGGRYAFDAALLIRQATDSDTPDYRTYSLQMQVGDGVTYAPEIRFISGFGTTSIDQIIPRIDLQRVGEVPASLVNVMGIARSTDGRGVVGATVRLARGANLGATTVLSMTEAESSPASFVARRLTSDASGRFDASGLWPGIYTVYVTSDAFVAKLYAQVTVDGRSEIVLDNLQAIASPANELPRSCYTLTESSISFSANFHEECLQPRGIVGSFGTLHEFPSGELVADMVTNYNGQSFNLKCESPSSCVWGWGANPVEGTVRQMRFANSYLSPSYVSITLVYRDSAIRSYFSSVRPPPSGSVVFSRPHADEGIRFSENFYSGTDFYQYYFMGYEALENPPKNPRYWVVSRPFDTVRIRMISGPAQCNQMEGGLIDDNGNWAGSLRASHWDGEYCNFGISRQGLNPPYMEMGLKISAIYISPDNNRPSYTIGAFTLAGSSKNEGRSVNGFNNADRSGGFAFQFCSGACDENF